MQTTTRATRAQVAAPNGVEQPNASAQSAPDGCSRATRN